MKLKEGKRRIGPKIPTILHQKILVAAATSKLDLAEYLEWIMAEHVRIHLQYKKYEPLSQELERKQINAQVDDDLAAECKARAARTRIKFESYLECLIGEFFDNNPEGLVFESPYDPDKKPRLAIYVSREKYELAEQLASDSGMDLSAYTEMLFTIQADKNK